MKEEGRGNGVIAEDCRHGVNAAGNLAIGLRDTLRVLDEETVEDDFVVHDGEDLPDLLVVLLFHLQREKPIWTTTEKRDRQKSWTRE